MSSRKQVGRSIFNEHGLVLLGEQVELTQDILDRLIAHGVDYIYIHDDRTEDVVVPEPISAQTRKRAIQGIRTSFRRLMETKGRQQGLGNIHLGKQFKDLIVDILDELSENQQALSMLLDMNIKDHYLFQHSLNVCLYTSVMGLSYGYDRDELTMLSVGALLHDIGKTLMPDEILLKSGPLTDQEYEVMKLHAENGFKLLKDVPNIPLLSAHCALQHHERLNGSGYPRGLTGSEIHDYAKWIAIADSYDAMTTNRVYRKAMLPHEAMEILFAGAGSLYEQNMIEVFRDQISLYPLGMTVRLNTGEVGVVVDLNSTYAKRPIVRILRNENGEDLKEPYELDLSKKLSIIIVSVEPY